MNPTVNRKVMLITGGSRGIGAATAKLAAKAGYNLCLSYLQDAKGARDLCGELIDMGATAVAYPADVAIEDDVLALFQACQARYGRLDVLVNNAGVLDQQTTLANMSAARMQRILNTNVLGSLICAREAAAMMRANTQLGNPQVAQSGGVIVNLSSAAARLGGAGQYVDYAASKGAIDSMTFGLAQELGPQGIRVVAVAPGIIDTDIHASGGDPGRAQRLGPATPAGRAGSADEVAQAIVWLASDAASYVSGGVLDVTGGR